MMQGARSTPKPRCVRCGRPLSQLAWHRGEWQYHGADLWLPRHNVSCQGRSLRAIQAAGAALRGGR